MKANMHADNNLFIGLDLGTTHIKSAVFDDHGTLMELTKEPTPVRRDEYGHVYDPLEFYSIVKKQLLLWLEKYPDIKGVSITGMSEAGLVVDRCDCKELTPIIPWFDQRTTELSKEINEEAERTNFYKTGLHNSYKYGIYKYVWLLNHNAFIKENTIWLSVCDYIGWRLTGIFSSDPTFAARTYLYDIRKQSWDLERMKQYGLTELNFPVIRPSGDKIGTLNDTDILSAYNRDNIIVAIGGHDHVCAAYAVLGNESNHICNSIGTAETYLGVSSSFQESIECCHSGMIYGPYLNPEQYFWMANIPSSGQSVEWFCKDLQATPIDYNTMNEMLQAIPEGPTGIIYYPYLSGIGTPVFRSDVSGAILGIRKEHGASDMLKAILEGINYQGRWILSLVPDLDLTKFKGLICVGGAAESAPWMQIKADILGLPVRVPQISEATLLGTIAVMIEKNYSIEAKQKFLKGSCINMKLYEADHKARKSYEEVYQNKYAFLIDKILL